MINRIWKEETRKTGVNEYTTKKTLVEEFIGEKMVLPQ